MEEEDSVGIIYPDVRKTFHLVSGYPCNQSEECDFDSKTKNGAWETHSTS